MTWEEFVHKDTLVTWERAMLLQCICALSCQKQFENQTPWEIFDHINRTRSQYEGEAQ